MKKIFRKES